MKNIFYRKISVRHGKYGEVSLPKLAYAKWSKKGCHNVRIEYDTDADSLTVTPA